MRLAALLATGAIVAMAAVVWRSRNGVEVWHVSADAIQSA
jgi:hypothetical protein